MEYKIDKKTLLEIMEQWNRFLKRRVLPSIILLDETAKRQAFRY